MGLFNALKRLWLWLWNGSGFDVEELARRLAWKATELKAIEPAYRQFTVPKRSRGRRRLCAPADPLKALQRQILRRLLRRLKVHPTATGFRRGESIATHARRHIGQAVVLRLDLKDFFPATRSQRVYAYFRKIGWNRPAARLLTRLCTYEGGLPQGAPTSPCLSNLVNYRVDCRLAAMARKLGATYSRYADDITFSLPADKRWLVRYLRRFVRRVVNVAGYQVHGTKKLRIRRQHQQQCVTGLVVNEEVNLPRDVRRRIRAVEHHLRTGRPATMTSKQLAGWRALQQMIAAQRIDPRRAEAIRREKERLAGTWVVVAIERAGSPVGAEQFAQMYARLRWIVGADAILVQQGDERVEASYRLDASRKPKTLDLVPTCGPARGKRLRGIYQLHADTLHVCTNDGRGPRPGEFATACDARCTLLTMRRERSAETDYRIQPGPGARAT